jgi:hypothetical protein
VIHEALRGDEWLAFLTVLLLICVRRHLRVRRYGPSFDTYFTGVYLKQSQDAEEHLGTDLGSVQWET